MTGIFSQKYESLVIATCLLLCIRLIGFTEAGKAKVPIYMPIPIPVPMPVGPLPDSHRPHSLNGNSQTTNSNSNFNQHSISQYQQPQQQQHQQQQQQHQQHQPQPQHEDEGEVKKIYLLQPIPKVGSERGSGEFGSAAHGASHMQLPGAGHSRKPSIIIHQQAESSSLAGFGEPRAEEQAAARGFSAAELSQKVSSHMQSSDMKILPIVVIPPIAPMPPIQLTPGAEQSAHAVQSHRSISMAPQINNYISSSEPPPPLADRYQRAHLTQTAADMHQDRSTFSDYGGSVGGAFFRDSYGPSAMRGHRRPRPMRMHSSPAWRASRLRPRFSPELNDDYSEFDAVPVIRLPVRGAAHFQRANLHAPGPMGAIVHNHKWIAPHRRGFMEHRLIRYAGGPPKNPRLDSIKDVIDQQVLFDDDDEAAKASNRMMSEHLAADNTDIKDTIASVPREMYQELPMERGKRNRPALMHHKGSLAQPEVEGLARLAQGTTYYQHDIMQPNAVAGQQKDQMTSGTRVYNNEREAIEDDEWWFDTVKSVTHATDSPLNTTLSTASANVTLSGNLTSSSNLNQKLNLNEKNSRKTILS